jgi:hypothetical protein
MEQSDVHGARVRYRIFRVFLYIYIYIYIYIMF